MSSPVTVDVTTGDKITPESVEYSCPLLFDDRSIAIMSYLLATTLAEKLEIAISRSVTNTRPRDYYDLHTLWLTRRDEAKPDVLRDALATTVEKRGSHAAMGNYREVMAQVASDDGMLEGACGTVVEWEEHDAGGASSCRATVRGQSGSCSIPWVCHSRRGSPSPPRRIPNDEGGCV